MATFTIDGSSDLTVIQNPDNALHTFTYDGEHKLTREDLGSRYGTVAYDADNDTASSVNQGGSGAWTIIPRLTQGLTTGLNLAADDVARTVDPRNSTYTYLLNDLGLATSITDPNGNEQQWAYNANGQITRYTDALNNVNSYTYSGGNLTSVTNPLNKTWTYTYNSTFNKVATVTDPLGQTATFAYNAVGMLSSSTDRLGRRRDFEYDALNRMTTQIWYESGNPVETTTYSYDPNGNPLTASNSTGTYTMSYDALNRVTVLVDVWGKTLTFTYDAVGNRTKVEDSAGGVTTSTYNAINLLTKREFGGSGQTPLRIDFTYNAVGQIETETRYSNLAGTFTVATTSFSYDAVGRIENLHHRDGSATNIANYTFTYDAGNRLTSETRNGTTTSYTYDTRDQLTADGTATFTYDGTGNCISYAVE